MMHQKKKKKENSATSNRWLDLWLQLQDINWSVDYIWCIKEEINMCYNNNLTIYREWNVCKE